MLPQAPVAVKSRQVARAEARRLSKLWVSTRLRGPRDSRKTLAANIFKSNWKTLLHEADPIQQDW
jgi:hypothetical protein